MERVWLLEKPEGWGLRVGFRVVGGARGRRGASDQPWRPARRVVRARGLPAAAVVRSGPDWQRPLRGVSFGTLPRALQPWPGALRQQQRHLRVLVPPPPGYLLSGPLHWRTPPGQLHRCGAGWGAESGSNPQPSLRPHFSLFVSPGLQASPRGQMQSQSQRRRTSCDLQGGLSLAFKASHFIYCHSRD